MAKIISLAHTLLIILAWASPFYLDWKIILIGIFIISIQELIFKGCILTNLQFNKKIKAKSDNTMYYFYLEKIGFKPNKKKIKFLARYIFPLIILILAIIWQILLNHSPIIKL